MTFLSLSYIEHARLCSIAFETLNQYNIRYFEKDVRQKNYVNIPQRRCLHKRIELYQRKLLRADVLPCCINREQSAPQFFILADRHVPHAAFVFTQTTHTTNLHLEGRMKNLTLLLERRENVGPSSSSDVQSGIILSGQQENAETNPPGNQIERDIVHPEGQESSGMNLSEDKTETDALFLQHRENTHSSSSGNENEKSFNSLESQASEDTNSSGEEMESIPSSSGNLHRFPSIDLNESPKIDPNDSEKD